MPCPYRIVAALSVFASWRETNLHFLFLLQSKITAVENIPKMDKKNADFAGLSYFFENEVSSSTISPTEKKLFKQEPTEITEEKMMTPFPPSLPIQNPKSKIQNSNKGLPATFPQKERMKRKSPDNISPNKKSPNPYRTWGCRFPSLGARLQTPRVM
jgi:hypothetical protein